MNWEDVYGAFETCDARFVSSHCEQILGGLVVEIGVLCGRATCVMAPICKCNGTLYFAVDNFCGGTEEKDPATTYQLKLGTEGSLPRLKATLTQAGLIDWVEIIKSDSAEAAGRFEDGTVDFCFIDADHTYPSVDRDIHAWWPKIRPQGFLSGHDYGIGEGVKRAVNELCARENLELELGGHGKRSCWAVRKP